MYIGLTQLGSQNLNFKVVHVRCINYSTDIFAFFSILNYPILASSYVYYFYFSSIEIIDIRQVAIMMTVTIMTVIYLPLLLLYLLFLQTFMQ